ncbi:MAG: cysteine desulfurase [Clostridia bacterium]|nr:cysteine desulfurase [Clostridia bacterium]
MFHTAQWFLRDGFKPQDAGAKRCFILRKEIYLDNSATTKPSAQAIHAAVEMMESCWGNPSSTHAKGDEAAAVLGEARRRVASALSSAPQEIFFTSGGTEANNIAVFGAAAKNAKVGRRIVTTAIEHSSVMDSVGELERRGFEVVRLQPDRFGHISPEAVWEAITSDTILVTMMLVNNEVGSILPVEEAVRAARKNAPRALVHCDCVQAFGKMPVNVNRLGADTVTISAHKIHALKGVGALWKRKGLHLPPLTFGGHQENSFRPGTEAAPLIAAFGAAAAVAGDRGKMTVRTDQVRMLWGAARQMLLKIDGIGINSPEDGSPYILNFSTCCVKAETMLNYLSNRGIYVSGGSACAKGEPSHVIKALNLSHDAADSAIRVSFCADNTSEEVRLLADAVAEGIKTLAHFQSSMPKKRENAEKI